MNPQKILPFGLALVLNACGSQGHAGGQTGEENTGCTTVSETELAPGEKSPLGFGGDDLLALAGGFHSNELTWSKGGTTTATVSFTPAGAARYAVREWRSRGDQMLEIGAPLECTNAVTVEGTLTLSTTDGAFDESWDATLLQVGAGAVYASVQLYLDALGGSYTVTEVDPSQLEDITASGTLEFLQDGAHGTLSGIGTKLDSSGPDGTASGISFGIATF